MTKKETKTTYLSIEGKSFETVQKVVEILTTELGATDVETMSHEDGDLNTDELLFPYDWNHSVEAFLMFEVPIRSGDPIVKIKKLLKA